MNIFFFRLQIPHHVTHFRLWFGPGDRWRHSGRRSDVAGDRCRRRPLLQLQTLPDLRHLRFVHRTRQLCFGLLGISRNRRPVRLRIPKEVGGSSDPLKLNKYQFVDFTLKYWPVFIFTTKISAPSINHLKTFEFIFEPTLKKMLFLMIKFNCTPQTRKTSTSRNIQKQFFHIYDIIMFFEILFDAFYFVSFIPYVRSISFGSTSKLCISYILLNFVR